MDQHTTRTVLCKSHLNTSNQPFLILRFIKTKSCAQCFQPFENGLFFEFEARKYCENDFQLLFAPCCKGCGECIIGRVIKAMNFNWHDRCFKCYLCNLPLADVGFVKNNSRYSPPSLPPLLSSNRTIIEPCVANATLKRSLNYLERHFV